jgi:hypothetical protein
MPFSLKACPKASGSGLFHFPDFVAFLVLWREKKRKT